MVGYVIHNSGLGFTLKKVIEVLSNDSLTEPLPSLLVMSATVCHRTSSLPTFMMRLKAYIDDDEIAYFTMR